MVTTLIDLTGQQFGRLTVVKRAGTNCHGEATWLCKCECGNTHTLRGSCLRNGGSTSCGCLAAELASARLKTHGKTNTRLFRIWARMIERCERSYNKSYSRYGGRGISVCEEWKTSFPAFYEWASSSGYGNDLSIDRIDNDGNYEPVNCRWATIGEQANNRSSNSLITVGDKTKTLTTWAKERGVAPDMIARRIKKGWPTKCAIYSPIGGK